MAREFKWLSALNPVFPLAPRAYVVCDDLSIAGAAFYVMERRHGIIVRGEEEPAPIAGDPALRRRVGEAFIDTLARLHSIDIHEHGLSHLGKPAGFVERQVRGWSERWERYKTTDVPELDALSAWLRRRVPPDPVRPAIVHGDFKPDNILLDAVEPNRVVALFDWELAALGEPLIDLGMLLVSWVPSAPPGHRDVLSTVTDRPGWPTRDELLERYSARSGRSVEALPYFELFAFFKFAVILQQLYYRHVRGLTDDPRFDAFGDRVVYLGRSAMRLIERI